MSRQEAESLTRELQASRQGIDASQRQRSTEHTRAPCTQKTRPSWLRSVTIIAPWRTSSANKSEPTRSKPKHTAPRTTPANNARCNPNTRANQTCDGSYADPQASRALAAMLSGQAAATRVQLEVLEAAVSAEHARAAAAEAAQKRGALPARNTQQKQQQQRAITPRH